MIFVSSPFQARVRLPDAVLECITLCGCQAPTCPGEPLVTSLLGDTSLLRGGGTPWHFWATKPGPPLSRTRGCPHDQNQQTGIDRKVELVSIPQNCQPVGPTRCPGPTPDPANLSLWGWSWEFVCLMTPVVPMTK